MQTLSLVWGILAIIGMIVGFFPCLGAFNWLNIPFAVIGLFVSLVAFSTTKEGNKDASIAGIVCCAIATVVGTMRLIIGLGVL